MTFKLQAPFIPTGDQPEAIAQLVDGVRKGMKHQVLLGATGTGKTFTIASVIQELQKPALIMAHNKTLAAQLYAEFKDFFPENAVEYFVSYYDYYQPEAYVPRHDLYIEKDGDGYRVIMNDDGLPRLRISSYYRSLLTTEDLPVATRDYIQKKFSSALWLVKSIHQRQRTIRRVAESIVRHQRAFLDHGMDHLRPMVLRDVAEDIGVHESTVSRVTNRKYVQTPQGLFELKFFFTAGIARESGQSAASTSVQSILKKIIASEPADRPYSDQDLVILLKRDHGLEIARRTVAKYRDILRILPSSKRRRHATPAT